MNARLADDLKQHLAVAACLRPRGWRPTSGGARHERDIAQGRRAAGKEGGA
jgi:hypothetical protein